MGCFFLGKTQTAIPVSPEQLIAYSSNDECSELDWGLC